MATRNAETPIMQCQDVKVDNGWEQGKSVTPPNTFFQCGPKHGVQPCSQLICYLVRRAHNHVNNKKRGHVDFTPKIVYNRISLYGI